MNLKKEWPWAAALAVMAAVIVVLPFLAGRTLVDDPRTLDVGNQWIAFASHLKSCYASGQFPLWDHHDLCGTPFLAFSHTNSLYPPWIGAHLAFDGYSTAAPMDMLFHLILAALGAYAALRAMDVSRPSSFLGAMAYAFSGFIFANINFPPSLHTGAWLACWYAACFHLLKKGNLAVFILASVCVAGMALGGDLEMMVYGLLGMCFELWMRKRERDLTLERVMTPALSVGVGLLAAAALLLPAQEFQALSIRSAGDFRPAIGLSQALFLPLLAVFQVPLPADLYPPNNGLDPWYLGVIPLMFLAVAVKAGHKLSKRAWIFPVAAAYAIIFYAYPFKVLTSRVPILGSMIVPFRAWPVLTIFFLIAAAAGMDHWLGHDKEADPGTGKTGILPLGVKGAWFAAAFAAAVGLSLVLTQRGIVSGLVFCLALAGAALYSLKATTSLTRSRRAALILLIAGLDLYLSALAWSPRADPEDLDFDRRVIPFLADSSGESRYAVVSILGIIDPGLPYHLGLRINADTIDSFSRVPPRDSALRLARLYPPLIKREKGKLINYDQMALRSPDNIDPRELSLFNAMNVRWIVSRFPWDPGPPLNLKPRLSEPGMRVYENLAAAPRAYFRRAGRVTPARVTHDSPNSVLIETPEKGEGSSHGKAELNLAQSWYPGWNFTSGEERIMTRETDLGFVAADLEVPAVIRAWFAPVSFRTGLWISLSTMAAGLIAVTHKAASVLRGKGRTQGR